MKTRELGILLVGVSFVVCSLALPSRERVQSDTHASEGEGGIALKGNGNTVGRRRRAVRGRAQSHG